MVQNTQDRGLSPVVDSKVDEAQRKQFKDLCDRLDRLLGRKSASGVSSMQTSNHLSTEFASVSLKDSADRLRSDNELWQLRSDGDVVRVLPEVEVAAAQRDVDVPAEPAGTATPARSQKEEEEETKEEATPSSPQTPPPAAQQDDADSPNNSCGDDSWDGRYGTVKSLKNHRDIDFSVKFVNKKRRK